MAEGTLRMLLARQPATSLEVLGMLALPPLLVCALFSIGKRFRDPRRQLYIVLVVGLVMLGDAGQAWSRIEQNRQRELANAGIRDAMAVLRRMAGARETGALPDIDPTPRAHGAYGELERAVKTVAGQRLARHRPTSGSGRHRPAATVRSGPAGARHGPGGKPHDSRTGRPPAAGLPPATSRRWTTCRR